MQSTLSNPLVVFLNIVAQCDYVLINNLHGETILLLDFPLKHAARKKIKLRVVCVTTIELDRANCVWDHVTSTAARELLSTTGVSSLPDIMQMTQYFFRFICIGFWSPIK